MSHLAAAHRRRYGPILVIIAAFAPAAAVSADQPRAEAKNQSSYYTYHDDWAIVSAPPPPGPYQSVNLDPRIPGQEDVMRSFADALPPAPSLSEQGTEDIPDEPPAAGPSPAHAGTYTGWGSVEHQPPPGYYSARGFGTRRSTPVQEYRGSSYYGYPQSGAPRYGYTLPPWRNAPVQRTEDEVPPPPVYNRIVSPPPPSYRGGPVPDQGYPRGAGMQ